MKFFATSGYVTLAVVAASASPIEKRQFGFGGTGSTANELDGPCRAYTFVFARGSTEIGNMGSTVGPPTCDGLKDNYGSDQVACQGVGGAYDASIGTNALPQGTTPAAIQEAAGLIQQAASNCPDTQIVAGGYSQGAAVMTGAVSSLDASVQDRVAGVVLYGNTQNAKNSGKIPNYPPDNALTICAPSDGVCGGALLVTAGHLGYTSDVPEAVSFLEDRLAAQGTSSAGGSAGGNTGGSTGGAAAGGAGGDSGSGGFGGFGGFGSGLFGGRK